MQLNHRTLHNLQSHLEYLAYQSDKFGEDTAHQNQHN